jgi:CTD kinase subunit beta
MSESSPLAPNTPSTPTTSSAITAGSSFKRHYRPYFTKRQLATLNSLRKAGAPSVKEISIRHSSCKFIQDVGKKLGL